MEAKAQMILLKFMSGRASGILNAVAKGLEVEDLQGEPRIESAFCHLASSLLCWLGPFGRGEEKLVAVVAARDVARAKASEARKALGQIKALNGELE
ncbi:hypothetical protein ACLOJK_026117 [Asimina triloba]